ncbi:MAG: hypothetical protein FJ381_05665 [Verrucomicrobia bacterium]|nr:hypothetical protein [Verrucomicrobiota bacterium]
MGPAAERELREPPPERAHVARRLRRYRGGSAGGAFSHPRAHARAGGRVDLPPARRRRPRGGTGDRRYRAPGSRPLGRDAVSPAGGGAPEGPGWGPRLRAAAAPQALVAEPGAFLPAAHASLWADGPSGWARIWTCGEAVAGRAGFAAPGAKREGDGKSPSGSFRISLAFGYAPAGDTALPYRCCTAADLWVDDPESPDYNLWVTAPHPARSVERMRRDDALYEFGLALDYNRHPVVPGAGSAIFVHVRDDRSGGTAGCLALPREEMVALLRLLRPGAFAVFNPRSLAV